MTIDEAITHTREVAEEQRIKNRTCGNCKYCIKGQIHKRQGYCYFNTIHYEHDLTHKACSNWESNDDIGCKRAEEHEQLAEWLEELKQLRNQQTPKKIKCYEDKFMHCPCCEEALGYKWKKYPTEKESFDWLKYCWNCGQKLDWSN